MIAALLAAPALLLLLALLVHECEEFRRPQIEQDNRILARINEQMRWNSFAAMREEKENTDAT